MKGVVGGIEVGIDLGCDAPAVQLLALMGLPVEDLDIVAATDVVAAWEALVRRCEAGRAEAVAHLARMHGGATPSHDGPTDERSRKSWEKGGAGSSSRDR